MTIDDVLESIPRYRDEWEAGYVGTGGIGAVMFLFPAAVISPEKDVGGKLFRPPLDLIRALAFLKTGMILTLRKGEPCEDRFDHPFYKAADLLEIPFDEADAIDNALFVRPGHDHDLRRELLSELQVPDGKMLDWRTDI